MNRIVEFELVGKTYPLNFSVKVARQLDEEFGGFEKLGEVMLEGTGKGLTAACALLHQMMEQGAAYQKLTKGKEIEIPNQEDLEVLIGLPDYNRVQEAVLSAAGIGSQPTVEVEPDEKNGKTTQSE